VADGPKPPLIVFPFEAQLHEELFERTPLLIVKKFPEAFDSEGRQAFEVPQHVLEALAKRFIALMARQHNSLDAAFGGCVARQRNELLAEEGDWSVLWKFLRELEKVESETPSERGAGTTFEIALERLAEELDMSPDNIRRIYKKGGPRAKKRRNRPSR
jgi:hypothetical protein